jgi:hypothetical protein
VRPLDELLVAPLSGAPCVLHRSHARVVANEGHVEHDEAVEAASRFAIDTPTGRVIVEEAPALAIGASPVIPRDEQRELALLARLGIPLHVHRYAGFDEIALRPGTTIVIRGMVKIELDPSSTAERGYRDNVPTVIRLVGGPDAPLTIRDAWS